MIYDPKLTPRQSNLRAAVLRSADHSQATAISNTMMIEVCDRFNDFARDQRCSMATSLMARSLFIYAMLDVSASWWADVAKLPKPDTHAAALDLALNLDPGIEGESYTVETE